MDGFHRLISDLIHSIYPLHLISGFQLFRHAFTFGYLLYQLLEHILCLPVDVGQIAVQLTAGQQVGKTTRWYFFR